MAKQPVSHSSGFIVSLLLFNFFLSLVSFAAVPTANAQSENMEKLFDEGLILYRNKQFDLAKLKFMATVAEPRLNLRITASYLILAKTLERLGDFSAASSYANTLLREYPQSRYVGDAFYVIGSVKYQQGLPLAALDNFLYVMERSQSKELLTLSEQLANRLVEQGIGLQKIEDFKENHPSPTVKSWLTLWEARYYYVSGKRAAGDELLRNFLATNPESRFARAARQLQQTPSEELSVPVRVGVLLPLSGFFATEAKELLRGLAFALKERSASATKIELVVRDSKGSMVEAIRSMNSLMQEDITIAIGELEGSKSAAVASIAAQAGVPIIVPVATDNGLTAIGNEVFQANNDLETRGETLAQYAVDHLHMRTFATLAPSDEYGHAITDAFANTVDRLGGSIISQQWYYPGTQVFKRHFIAIRTAAFRNVFRDSLLAQNVTGEPSLMDTLSSAFNRRILSRTESREGMAEMTNLPVTSIDGFFFPAYEEDLAYIVPQFAFYNIHARPLGGEYWLNEEQLRNQRKYVNGAVFVAGNYTSELDAKYRDFRNRFRQVTATSPTAMSLYGYNLMQLLIQDIEAGNINASDIAAYLEKVDNFPGIGGNISFAGNSRVNKSVNLLQFQDGNIFKLESR